MLMDVGWCLHAWYSPRCYVLGSRLQVKKARIRHMLATTAQKRAVAARSRLQKHHHLVTRLSAATKLENDACAAERRIRDAIARDPGTAAVSNAKLRWVIEQAAYAQQQAATALGQLVQLKPPSEPEVERQSGDVFRNTVGILLAAKSLAPEPFGGVAGSDPGRPSETPELVNEVKQVWQLRHYFGPLLTHFSRISHAFLDSMRSNARYVVYPILIGPMLIGADWCLESDVLD